MMHSINAFFNELALIKHAELEAQEEEKPQLDKKKLFKQLALNTAAYGSGLGLGTGLSYVGAEKVLPKYFPKMPGWKRWGLGGGVGLLTGLGGLATWEAMRLARKHEDDVAKRDSQGVRD